MAGEQCPDGDVDGGEQGATSEEFGTPVRPGPIGPSTQERDQHEATGHVVFRNWCSSCIEGRGRALPHTRREHMQNETPVLSWDYGFLGTKTHGGEQDRLAEQSGQTPVLCMRDRKSQSCFWYVAPHKGADFPSAMNLVPPNC